MIPVIKTGLFWMMKSNLTEVQLKRLRYSYSYPNPKDLTAPPFETFIELDDKFGVPTGDLQKLLSIVPDVVIEDRTVVPKFSTTVNAKGLALRDYQEVAMQEITEYFNKGGTCMNLAGSCGSGKSFMLAALLAKMKVKVLIIAHLSSLIEQLKNEIESATGMTVTVLNAKNKTIGDINVATSQFISKNEDVWYQIKHGVGMIVVDEAETVGSLSTLRILQRSYARYRVLIRATFSRSVDKRTSALLDIASQKRVVLEATGMLNPTVIQVQCPERFSNPPNKNLYQRAKGVFFSNENIDDKVILVTESSLQKDRQELIAVDIIEVQNR
jgi:hypothetical protein